MAWAGYSAEASIWERVTSKMNRMSREREVKLDLLTSLARSQTAMARILESVAEVAVSSPDTAKALQQELRSLTRLQHAIAANIAPLRLPPVQEGAPGPVWLRWPELAVTGSPGEQTSP